MVAVSRFRLLRQRKATPSFSGAVGRHTGEAKSRLRTFSTRVSVDGRYGPGWRCEFGFLDIAIKRPTAISMGDCTVVGPVRGVYPKRVVTELFR